MSVHSVEQFLNQNLVRITSFLLSQHSPVMPYRVTVHFSEHLPALLIRLYKTQNYDELQMLEDLSQKSQK